MLYSEWNISFAGCGFLGVYYFGVYSCLLERAPHLVKRSKICGASSGALIGAMIACQMSPAKCCKNLMELYKEARKGILGAMHPSFNLLKLTRKVLVRELPDNAHLLASGKLCLSLTRVLDGENVLVSEFTSKEDLIQAVLCSCFFPVYCGVVPPSYHGTHYVDGALSNNLPYFTLKNTITVSPFSGESDICPHDSPFYFHELRHSNVSIRINFANTHRVIQAFFPPNLEVMAELCQNGYRDALHFFRKNDLIEELPVTDIITQTMCFSCSHYSTYNFTNYNGNDTVMKPGSVRGQDCELDQQINLLPESVRKVFCNTSRKKHWWLRELLVVKLITYILMVSLLPVEMVYYMLLSYFRPVLLASLLAICFSFLCGVCMFSPCLRGFSPTVQRRASEVVLMYTFTPT